MDTVFVIDPRDNVATALGALPKGRGATALGESPVCEIVPGEEIRAEHKVALRRIERGEDVVKYGMPIGYAVREIEPGEWVHLHNCASHYDERSNTLDGDTGAPTDTRYV